MDVELAISSGSDYDPSSLREAESDWNVSLEEENIVEL